MIQKSLDLEVTPPQVCKESCSTQDGATEAHLCTRVSLDCELAYMKLGFKQMFILFIFLKIQKEHKCSLKSLPLTPYPASQAPSPETAA